LRISGGDYINATTVAMIVISLLLLCLTSGLMGIITTIATGPSPVYCGSGYLPSKDFWRLGVIFLTVFFAIGVPWVMAIK
jgi:L-tartrate/succinate antiporter